MGFAHFLCLRPFPNMLIRGVGEDQCEGIILKNKTFVCSGDYSGEVIDLTGMGCAEGPTCTWSQPVLSVASSPGLGACQVCTHFLLSLVCPRGK